MRDQEAAIFWRDNTLRLMHQNGYIDDITLAVETGSPLRTVQGGDYADFRTTLPDRDYFTD